MKIPSKLQNELSEEIDIEIPPPVYFFDFLNECRSPWLHYGYCKSCFEVARYTGKGNVSKFCAHKPGPVIGPGTQCWARQTFWVGLQISVISFNFSFNNSISLYWQIKNDCWRKTALTRYRQLQP